jgi:hypothetical protein
MIPVPVAVVKNTSSATAGKADWLIFVALVMNTKRIRHITAILLLAVFIIKGMAGIMSLFSIKLNSQALIELVHSSEQEESKNIPESKHEGEPNEYFITHSFGATAISISSDAQKNLVHGSAAEQPGFGTVPTPPPDQA